MDLRDIGQALKRQEGAYNARRAACQAVEEAPFPDGISPDDIQPTAADCGESLEEWAMLTDGDPALHLRKAGDRVINVLRGRMFNLVLALEQANARAERLIDERIAWGESAMQFSLNEDYYRGLVIRIGKAIGPEAYTADDGSISEDVLCAKVPELVERLKEAAQGALSALRMATPEFKPEIAELEAVLVSGGEAAPS